MASTQLPPLNFGDGLRISLFPPECGSSTPDDLAIPDIPDIPELADTPPAQAHTLPSTVYAELDGLDTEMRASSMAQKQPQPPLKELPLPLGSLPSQDLSAPQELPSAAEGRRPPPPPLRLSSPSELAAPPRPPAQIPVHPIPSLQDAFTESLDEATHGTLVDKPKLRALDAVERRERLIAQDRDAVPFDATWRYRPGQRQHELFKLLAQISFGVYLMLNGMANSTAQVVTILQGHIDEVDEFLEVTLEDLAQATHDLNGRIDHLKLPLSNINVFEELLEDRNFRCEILEGNEKIDHVLSRTNMAMKQWDDDIDAGLQCTAAFTSWLHDETEATLGTVRPDLADVLDAMKGNAEGWLNAFDEINDAVQEVSSLIIRLTTVIAEMEKKAGEVSRRTWANIPPFTAPAAASRMPPSHGKPLSVKSGSPRPSTAKLAQQALPSMRTSASTGWLRPPTIDSTDAETMEFPLPGGLPLLPPRASARAASDGSPQTKPSPAAATPEPGTAQPGTAQPPAAERLSPATDESLYVLQPRTYTPQLPEPMPSPMLRQPVASEPAPPPMLRQPVASAPSKAVSRPDTPRSNGEARGGGDAGGGSPQVAGSIRHRVSLKKGPPDAISIPARPTAEARGPSSGHATPRTVASQPLDSTYGSDADSRSYRQGSNPSSEHSLSPPPRPQMVRSPRSDQQQYYRPVQASPHSPLQQRPHTAAGPRASHFRPQHLRNQPSQLGSASTLSKVTTATYDERMLAPSTRGGAQSERTLKKKKSAFGWFKKAFSLDEEERAAFEARRAMAQQDRYYDSNSPKFLDGRRIR